MKRFREYNRCEQERLLLERGVPGLAEGAAQDRLLTELAQANGEPEAVRLACRRSDLRRLELALVEPEGADIVLDALLELMAEGGCVQDPKALPETVPAYTASLDAARGFAARTLPGFFVASGLCGLTGHASLGPDYRGPEGERLRVEWPEDETPCDWSEDLAPGDGIPRECRAILACAVRALAFQMERT